MSVLFALIFISVIALVLAVMIFILLRRISTLQGNDPERPDPRIVRYEESTRLLLEETRRQYERQISMLEQRLASREAEIEQRLERRSADLRRQSALEFSDLADEALRRESENLQNANRNDIDEILSPLRERIEEFRRAVSDSYIKENAQRTALSRQIETLVRANTEIGNEARRLSNALRGDTRLQGRWGETVLQRLLEQGGMIAGVHFSTQTASLDGKDLKSDDDGRGFRPDTIILLPGGHKIVVDAKTSMTDYLEYCDTTDPKEADACLRRHAASVRKHIKELADKQYHKLIDGALEHSLMFMPNDASYLAAIRADSALCEYALRNNVAIVAPAHMLSVVQLIAQLWRVEIRTAMPRLSPKPEESYTIRSPRFLMSSERSRKISSLHSGRMTVRCDSSLRVLRALQRGQNACAVWERKSRDVSRSTSFTLRLRKATSMRIPPKLTVMMCQRVRRGVVKYRPRLSPKCQFPFGQLR